MIQAMGRFSRLSGEVPSSCSLLVLLQTLDERIAFKLEEKLIDINATIDSGLSEEALEKSLGKEDWLTDFSVELSEHSEYLDGVEIE